MKTRFKYKEENNCLAVIDVEKNNEVQVLCNFTARIVTEEKRPSSNGNIESFYRIEGATKKGIPFDPVHMSADEFDQGKWINKYWGRSAILNEESFPKSKLYLHIKNAIIALSSKTAETTTSYSQTGFEKTKSGDFVFLYNNGAITPSGFNASVYCSLPTALSYYHLENNSQDDETKAAIREVFNLLDFSEKNPCLGILLALTAIRAVVSVWLPIEEYIFLVGPKQTFKSSTVKIIQSFFGAWSKSNSLISWESTQNSLLDYALRTRNTVLCVDDYVYPATRRAEFSNKSDGFLRAVANRADKSRANNTGRAIDNQQYLNSLVISTGEHPPRDVPESLLQRGIYFPVKYGDISTETLGKLQILAESGVYARALAAFIQYLLSDFEGNEARAKKWFKNNLGIYQKKFSLTDRDAVHMSSFTVGWAFFRKFAEQNDVITYDESVQYKNHVKNHLGELMSKQEKISSTNIGDLFVSGIKLALKEGRAHLKDGKTGKEPSGVDSNLLGWKNGKPCGLWIGWLGPKLQDVFIRGELDVDELIALLPEHDRDLFKKTGPKAFWKELKILKKLKCPDDGEHNSTRIVLPDALFKCNQHYRVKMKFPAKSPVDGKSKEKSLKKPSSKSRTVKENDMTTTPKAKKSLTKKSSAKKPTK